MRKRHEIQRSFFISHPEGTVWAQFGISRRLQFGWSAAFVKHEIPPVDFPIGHWVHIAYHIAADRPIVQWTQIFDRQHFNPNHAKGLVGFQESPLLIGGIEHLPFENETEWIGPELFESLKGYIDEIRISNGLRYAEDGSIRPKPRFQANANTLALWHFGEGCFAPRYADSSGNGVTLVEGGSLAGRVVDPRGKLAIIWGSLKRHSRF